MQKLDNYFFKFTKIQNLIPVNSHVLIGISGGQDSVVLTHLFKRMSHQFNYQITLAHINHCLRKNAKNIKIVRVASRVPFQDPIRINDKMLEVFSSYKNFRFELGTHVNHPIEFWKESVEAIKKLQSIGFRVYNQNPLLKGVNDDYDTLSKLFNLLRLTPAKAPSGKTKMVLCERLGLLNSINSSIIIPSLLG